MVKRHVSRLKLMARLAGGMVFCAWGSASAGMLFTADVINDFTITENATLDYHPDIQACNTLSKRGLKSSTKDSVDLYLSSESNGKGSSRFRFDIEETLHSSGGKESTRKRLSGVLESMQGRKGPNRFDFLVADGKVTGDLAKKSGGRGVFLTLAGGGGQGDLIYNRLQNPVLSQGAAGVEGGGGVPAAPEPGTIALLLTAGLPLLRSRRRG